MDYNSLPNFYAALDAKYNVTNNELNSATYTNVDCNFVYSAKYARHRWFNYKEGFSPILVEKIFNEYTSLSLRYPPRFTQVSTCEEALAQLSSMPYDLIICMPGTGDNEGFDVARTIKGQYEHIPMVILTPFSHGITKRIANEDLSRSTIFSVGWETPICWYPSSS